MSASELLVEVIERSESVTTPEGAVELWCMISAAVMAASGYQNGPNDCFCGMRQDMVDRGLWQYRGDSLRVVAQTLLPLIDAMPDRQHHQKGNTQ